MSNDLWIICVAHLLRTESRCSAPFPCPCLWRSHSRCRSHQCQNSPAERSETMIMGAGGSWPCYVYYIQTYLDLWDSTWSGWYANKIKIAQDLVVCSHLTLTLQYVRINCEHDNMKTAIAHQSTFVLTN